jgi:energy-coupling factor transport system permease protein
MQLILQYQAADSVMHRMDAITKFMWILILGAFGFLLSAPELVGILVVTVIATGLIFAGIRLGQFVKASAYFWILGTAAGFFQLIIRQGGEELVALGPLSITSEGLRFGLTFALRITLIATASLFYVWTTDPKKLVMAAVYLRVPYRIAYSLFVALRFVPLIENEARVIKEAQTIRGVEQVKGKIEAAKRYVVPLLASSLQKSQRMAIAMEARGFGFASTRTYSEDFRWAWQGGVLVLLFAGLGATLFWVGLGIEGGLFQQ